MNNKPTWKVVAIPAKWWEKRYRYEIDRKNLSGPIKGYTYSRPAAERVAKRLVAREVHRNERLGIKPFNRPPRKPQPGPSGDSDV